MSVAILAKNIRPDFQRERLSPHFVYESYDVESGLFYNRASVGFVLVANPLPGTESKVLTMESITNAEDMLCNVLILA